MKLYRGRRKLLVVIAAVAACASIIGILAIWLVHAAVMRAAQGRMYALGDDIPKHEVALVLGAKVYKNGVLSYVLKDRVDTAIALYKAGVVKKLLMSGDNRFEHYDEVTAMRKYAIDQGVPSDDVVRDFAGFRTYDSVYRAREIWGLKDMVIVSQKFHIPRSLYIAKKLGVDAVGVAAKDVNYQGLDRTKRREVAARVLAWLDVMIGRDPYFLGERETLSGDSQVTRVKE